MNENRLTISFIIALSAHVKNYFENLFECGLSSSSETLFVKGFLF